MTQQDMQDLQTGRVNIRRFHPSTEQQLLEYAMRSFHNRYKSHRRHVFSALESFRNLDLDWIESSLRSLTER